MEYKVFIDLSGKIQDKANLTDLLEMIEEIKTDAYNNHSFVLDKFIFGVSFSDLMHIINLVEESMLIKKEKTEMSSRKLILDGNLFVIV